jgi:hypothetical protein
MRNISYFGLCLAAVFYAAVGVFGLCFFLSAQPDMQSSTDGYGVFRVALQSEALRP